MIKLRHPQAFYFRDDLYSMTGYLIHGDKVDVYHTRGAMVFPLGELPTNIKDVIKRKI